MAGCVALQASQGHREGDVYALTDAGSAIRQAGSGHARGKVIVTV
jgi:hypothetical protein